MVPAIIPALGGGGKRAITQAPPWLYSKPEASWATRDPETKTVPTANAFAFMTVVLFKTEIRRGRSQSILKRQGHLTKTKKDAKEKKLV